MMTEERQPLRILIIDDNASDRREAKAALLNGSSQRYEFTEASTASEGIRLCSSYPVPDCVLLDLALPDADDLEVLARMPRDDGGLLGVAVVVLTGSAAQGQNQTALRAGAHDYVGKSWLGAETLTKAVENAIERLSMTRTLQAHFRVADAARATALHLEDQNRRVQEASHMKSLFLANISHELRTPLTAIIGFSDLLLSGSVAPQSPQFERFQGFINTSGRHLLRLVNDLLDLSRIESGQLTFFPEPVSLGQLTEDVLVTLDQETRRKRLDLRCEIDPTLDDLILDLTRLKQVFFNYLSNAIKFTPEGGRITLSVKAEGAAQLRIAVQDCGIGIAAADLPQLFTVFKQLDKSYSRQHQGAGLGLALTQHLVEAQGGSVGVDSVLGQGSTFWAVLNRQHLSHDWEGALQQ